MNAVAIYRALILVRGAWLLAEWMFGWGSFGHLNSLKLLHPFASLVGDAVSVVALLIIFAGLWFFCRWARLIFVLFVAGALVVIAFRSQHYSLTASPSFVPTINMFMVLLTGAIVAMSFLPPVRECFATKEV